MSCRSLTACRPPYSSCIATAVCRGHVYISDPAFPGRKQTVEAHLLVLGTQCPSSPTDHQQRDRTAI